CWPASARPPMRPSQPRLRARPRLRPRPRPWPRPRPRPQKPLQLQQPQQPLSSQRHRPPRLPLLPLRPGPRQNQPGRACRDRGRLFDVPGDRRPDRGCRGRQGATGMKYMLLIYNNPATYQAWTEEQRSALFGEVDALMKELTESGELVGGEALADASNAVIV